MAILPKRFHQFTTERNDSGLLSVERAPFEADGRAADHRAIVEADERAADMPSSKTDEQAAEHRAIVDGRRTSSGSPRAIVDSKGTTPDSIRRAYPIETLNTNI